MSIFEEFKEVKIITNKSGHHFRCYDDYDVNVTWPVNITFPSRDVITAKFTFCCFFYVQWPMTTSYEHPNNGLWFNTFFEIAIEKKVAESIKVGIDVESNPSPLLPGYVSLVQLPSRDFLCEIKKYICTEKNEISPESEAAITGHITDYIKKRLNMDVDEKWRLLQKKTDKNLAKDVMPYLLYHHDKMLIPDKDEICSEHFVTILIKSMDQIQNLIPQPLFDLLALIKGGLTDLVTNGDNLPKGIDNEWKLYKYIVDNILRVHNEIMLNPFLASCYGLNTDDEYRNAALDLGEF